jgi:hypothetical protein
VHIAAPTSTVVSISALRTTVIHIPRRIAVRPAAPGAP